VFKILDKKYLRCFDEILLYASFIHAKKKHREPLKFSDVRFASVLKENEQRL